MKVVKFVCISQYEVVYVCECVCVCSVMRLRDWICVHYWCICVYLCLRAIPVNVYPEFVNIKHVCVSLYFADVYVFVNVLH